MPASVVVMYAEQIESIRAEEKLHLTETTLVANADKKRDRDKAMGEWRKLAQKGQERQAEYTSAKPPPGFGVKKNG